MGVFKKETKKGTKYGIDLRHQGRRIRIIIGPSKKQAELVWQKTQVQKAEDRFLDVQRHQKVKFEEMKKLYIERHAKLHKRSAWRDEITLNHLASFFATKYLDEISPLDIEEYKAERLKRVAPATVNRELACLKHMFNKAIEWGKADKNPALKVKLLREDNRRVRYLERDEIKALLDACADHLRPIVVTALNTGMRKGEILPLEWSQVDLVRGKIYLYDTKSGKPRDVDINDWVADTLSELSQNRKGPYVFCSEKGKPYGDIKRSFETAKRKAGIEDFRFHDLRHNLGSYLAAEGVGPQILQSILGHSDYRMTQRYIHVLPGHKKAAMELFCKLMDTIWTPSLKKEKLSKQSTREKPHKLGVLAHHAEVAQSVALD